MKIDYYVPPQLSNWHGRKDSEQIERFYQSVQLYDLEQWQQKNIDNCVAIAGFACDQGIKRNQGRSGAVEGPKALRKALGNLPLHGKAKDVNLVDLGDIHSDEASLELQQVSLGRLVESLLSKNAFPIILGGGHETAWGHYLGLHEQYRKSNFAIVNFDAHFDMRPLLANDQGSSGTSFLQVAEYRKKNLADFNYYCIGVCQTSNTESLYKTASTWKVQYLSCDAIMSQPKNLHAFITQLIGKHDCIYVSLCLDVFNAAFAPGVSCIQPFGLTPWQVISSLQQLASSGKVVAFDIVELAPVLDRDELTAKLGALCLAEFLYHYKAKVK